MKLKSTILLFCQGKYVGSLQIGFGKRERGDEHNTDTLITKTESLVPTPLKQPLLAQTRHLRLLFFLCAEAFTMPRTQPSETHGRLDTTQLIQILVAATPN